MFVRELKVASRSPWKTKTPAIAVVVTPALGIGVTGGVTGNYFDVMGLRAARGRLLTTSDDGDRQHRMTEVFARMAASATLATTRQELESAYAR